MNEQQPTSQPQPSPMTAIMQAAMDRCRHNAAEAERVTAQEVARKESGQLTQQEFFGQTGITGQCVRPGQFSPC